MIGDVLYRGGNQVNPGFRTNTVIPKPPLEPDYELLLFFEIESAGGEPPTPTPPSLFTPTPDGVFPVRRVVAGFINIDTYLWRKTAFPAGLPEPDDYTVLHANARSQAFLFSVSSQQPGPLFAQNAGTGSGSITTAPGLTSLARGDMLVLWVSSSGFAGAVLPAPPPPFTVRNNAPAGNLLIATANTLATGATGNKQVSGLDNGPWSSGLVRVNAYDTTRWTVNSYAHGDGAGA